VIESHPIEVHLVRPVAVHPREGLAVLEEELAYSRAVAEVGAELEEAGAEEGEGGGEGVVEGFGAGEGVSE
jgi:hypothetical protein